MLITHCFSLIKNYKSFIFCYKAFGLKTAIRLPVLIGPKVKYTGIHNGSITLLGTPYCGMVKLGYEEGSSGIWKFDPCDGILDLSNGSITFGQNINITKGFCLKVIEGASVQIGSNFYANAYFTLLAKKGISIGENCLVGWNVLLNDGDGHSVISTITGKAINSKKEIIISNHVWLSAHVSVLKGTHILSNCIVGYGSIVGKIFNDENICIAGPFPGRVVKEDVTWG